MSQWLVQELKIILYRLFRIVDPHGHVRGRKLSLGLRGSTNGDPLVPVAEGEEEERGSDSETETMSSMPRVNS